MKSHYLGNLRPGDEVVNEAYLLTEVSRRTTRDGRLYLLCNFADKTGQMGGVFWDVPGYINEWVRAGLVVLVTGRINEYKDALQLTATDLNQATNPDMTDFLPSSQRPIDEMVAELRALVDSLAEPWQGLTRHLLLTDNALKTFINAPAARQMHHAYIGGLLEHTLSMAKIGVMLVDHYPYIDRDLLLTGVLLHDLGKTIEYTVEGQFGFSDDGRLVGHIVRAVTMIESAAAELGSFSADQLRQLIHLIVSHHGKQEWGSPTVPKTIEATLLHQIDLLDSRMQGFIDHLHSNQFDNDWTVQYSPMFREQLRRPAKYTPDS